VTAVNLPTQSEFEKKAAEERVKRAEMYDSTLEERARDQAAQLAEARDKESQHRATAAQMRSSTVISVYVSS